MPAHYEEPDYAGTPVVTSGYAARPKRGFQGALPELRATYPNAPAVTAGVARSGVDLGAIDRVYMGCVPPAGLGQAPARQATRGAGLPRSVEATTVNKLCGSGMQAVIVAHEAIASGAVDVVIAGSMESMSNAPHALPKHRSCAQISHDWIIAMMMMDEFENAYTPVKAMIAIAEDNGRDYQCTRVIQEAHASRPVERANAAIAGAAFAREVTPVTEIGPRLRCDCRYR